MARHSELRRAHPRPCGITLIEMCLALAVVGLVAGSIAAIFGVASDVVEKGRSRAELLQSGRAAMNRLLAELRTASAIEARSANYLRIWSSGWTDAGAFSRRVEFWVADKTLWRRVEGESEQALAENVTGLQTSGLTLWSKLDAATDVTNPQVGPAGFISGSSAWRTVYYNNGFSIPVGSVRSVQFPTDGVLSDARGTIEFWMRPEFSAEWRGADKDKYLVDGVVAAGEVELFFDRSERKLTFVINNSGSTTITWQPTWAPGAVVHVGLVWDCTGLGIGGGRTMALYINGRLREDVTETTTWTPKAFGSHFCLGNNDGTAAEAAFDNLRVYDYCKTDFRDRYSETALGLLRLWLTLEDPDNPGDTFTLDSGVWLQ